MMMTAAARVATITPIIRTTRTRMRTTSLSFLAAATKIATKATC
jgi:hypothetical protein